MDKKKARRESRILAVQAFFFYLERDRMVSIEDCFRHVLVDVDKKREDTFAQEMLFMAQEHFAKVKLVIKAFAPDVLYDKIAPINRAILHMGLSEIKYIGTPPVVVINEYIEVAKMFGEEKSGPFINAVIDSFRKSLGLGNERDTR